MLNERHRLDPSPVFTKVNESLEARNFGEKLTSSEIFQFANNHTTYGPDKEKLTDVLVKIFKEGDGFLHIAYEDLDPTVIHEIFESNKFKTENRADIIQELKGENIVMIYSDSYKLPTALPYVVRNSSPLTIYVNVTDFVTLDNYGKIKVPLYRNYGGLYAALFAAHITRKIMSSHISLSKPLLQGMTDMYSGMFASVAGRITHADANLKLKIRYLATQFMLIQMYGTEKGGMIFRNSLANNFVNQMGKILTDNIDNNFQIDSFDSLNLFILEMQRLYPSLKKMTRANFLENWMAQHGPYSTFMIEYPSLMIYALSCLYFSSPLINRAMIENLVSPKVINDAVSALEKI